MLTYLVVALLVCFVTNVPIGFSLGIASVVALLLGGGMSLNLVPQRLVAGVNSFPLLAIPFFMLAGAIMETGGVSRRIVALASTLVGHIRGGLGAVSVMACAFFAAISGSTPATAAAVGALTIPEMEARGYARDYAAAVVASSSCLGVIIPPSITMVIFGVVANVSIGALLIGGIVPGIFLAMMLIGTNYAMARKAGYPTEPRCTWRQRAKTFLDAFWGLMMPAIILGGIMSGVFTPTESAGIAVVWGLFVSMFIYREMTWKDLGPVLYKASLNSAMIMTLIAAANPFGFLMTIEQVPQMASQGIMGLTSNGLLLFWLILVIYLILGTFMETAAIILLVVPVFEPIARSIGLDMVHFGVITVISLAIGMATPPVGIALFATCGISGVPIGDLVRKIVPFLATLIAGLFLLSLMPFMSTFLPKLMM